MGAPDSTVHDLAATKRSEAATILAAGELLERLRSESKRPHELVHGVAYVILNDEKGGQKVEWLKEQFAHPSFRRGTVKLDDPKSFVAYVVRHATEQSAIYAKQTPAKFVAVLDEHPAPGPASQETSAVPARAAAWREFRAEYTPAFAPEWETWKRFDRQPFESTEKFAYFLEDNLPDIAEPAGAELLEVALNFRVNQDVRYSAAQRLQDGHAEITFQNLVEATAGTSAAAGKIRIPEKFILEVPVFAGIDVKRYRFEARFRYRLKAEGLKLWYELVRPQKVVEAAFTDLWTDIGAGTQRPILLGTPE